MSRSAARAAGAKAEPAVQGLGRRVVLTHLQGELAAAPAQGLRLDRGQQCRGNAPAAMAREHRQVVDVEQWAGTEGGEALEADGQPDGLLPGKGSSTRCPGN